MGSRAFHDGMGAFKWLQPTIRDFLAAVSYLILY